MIPLRSLTANFVAADCAAPAWADQLDDQLNKTALEIVAHLRKAGDKNVGVLQFGVQ